ncbi:MAG: hypothetical protein OXU25_00355 [Thaumarchaeota archaeon]|nr:hypothetical protein [Nitrososphaerota archaeon]
MASDDAPKKTSAAPRCPDMSLNDAAIASVQDRRGCKVPPKNPDPE